VTDYSLLDEISALPLEQQRAYVSKQARRFAVTVDEVRAAILTEWAFTGRRKQLAPPGDDWTYWWMRAGRGWGKTQSAAQWIGERGRERRCRIAVVAPTLGDVRSTCFEGVTGLLGVLPTESLLGGSRSIAWNKSLLELTLANGTLFKGFTSEEPDRLRGPQHDYGWLEEVSSWKDARLGDVMETTWSNFKLGLRLGDHPRAVLTSTPKSNRLTKHLVDLADDGPLRMVVGSSYENRANLSEAWWRTVVAPLEGTRTGRQEIEAELLEDVEGALWTRSVLDDCRVPMPLGWQQDPELRAEWAAKMRRIVVAVDPNTTSGESADNAGVVVVGLAGQSDGLVVEGHGYVLDDRTIARGGPRAWAAAAVDAYHDWSADRIVAETNNGGEMVELTIRGYERTVPYRAVTASRGKRTRAEPIAALYFADDAHEKVATMHHVGVFPEMEDELTQWTPADESPGRLDAMVWAATDLKVVAPGVGSSTSVARGDIPGIVVIGAGLPEG
jgi:phage terminase large subunit-like protein